MVSLDFTEDAYPLALDDPEELAELELEELEELELAVLVREVPEELAGLISGFRGGTIPTPRRTPKAANKSSRPAVESCLL